MCCQTQHGLILESKGWRTLTDGRDEQNIDMGSAIETTGNTNANLRLRSHKITKASHTYPYNNNSALEMS